MFIIVLHQVKLLTLNHKELRLILTERFLSSDSVESGILNVNSLELRLKETFCVEADGASRPAVGQFDFISA